MAEALNGAKIIEGRASSDWLTMQREATLKAFKDARKVKAKSPLVDTVTAESLIIAGKLDDLRKPAGMPGTLADIALAEVPDSEMDARVHDMLHQVHRDTKYLEELTDTQITPALLTGRLEDGKFGAFVRWIAPERRIFAGIEANVAGDYWMRNDVVRIVGKPPTPKDMWKSLVTRGTLPEVIATLDHELIHDKQYPKFILLYWLKKDIFPDDFLTELHAYAGEAASPTTNDPDLDEADELIDHIFDHYPDHAPTPRRAAFQAFNQLQTLRLLGYNDGEIGRIVSETRFDPTTKTFPRLVGEIKQSFAQLGLPKSEDQIVILRALKAAHNINLHYQRRAATVIACDTLEPFSRNKSWSTINGFNTLRTG